MGNAFGEFCRRGVHRFAQGRHFLWVTCLANFGLGLRLGGFVEPAANSGASLSCLEMTELLLG